MTLHERATGVAEFYDVLLSRRPEIESAYRQRTARSHEMYQRAMSRIPGGCTRDAAFRRPYPTFVESGRGSVMTDADGNSLIDFWFNATSLVLGHTPSPVREAVERQLTRGTAFYAPTNYEFELAEEICDRLLGAERVRYCNSGSEAVMMALRIARGFTSRSLVGKFEGSYHGSYDDVAWSVGPAVAHAGARAAPRAVPEGRGLPSSLGRTLVLPFNNFEAASALIEAQAGDLAAIILEPLANRMGFVEADRDFVIGLRELCTHHGIVLIFDEVISFRAGYRGMQGRLGIAPDLTTLGKIIGGGFPAGCVAGRANIMDVTNMMTPDRVAHTGTFNGNPITLTAGLATLKQLTPATFEKLDDLGNRARTKLREHCANAPLKVTGIGSLFKITATEGMLNDYRDSAKANRPWEELASLALLTTGYFLSANLQGCVSTATSPQEIDAMAETLGTVVG